MIHFIIYGKENCPYCEDVIEACKTMEDVCTYTYIDIEKDPEELTKFKAKHKTVPQVYLNDGTLIGDSGDFANYVVEVIY